MELTDQHYIVLLGVRDHATYRDIAGTLDRSVTYVQTLITFLSKNGFIENPNPKRKRATPWKLTNKAQEVLISNGYKVLSLGTTICL